MPAKWEYTGAARGRVGGRDLCLLGRDLPNKKGMSAMRLRSRCGAYEVHLHSVKFWGRCIQEVYGIFCEQSRSELWIVRIGDVDCVVFI